jgi:hypothetical protein
LGLFGLEYADLLSAELLTKEPLGKWTVFRGSMRRNQIVGPNCFCAGWEGVFAALQAHPNSPNASIIISDYGSLERRTEMAMGKQQVVFAKFY